MARLQLAVLTSASTIVALLAVSMLIAGFVNTGSGTQESCATSIASPAPEDSTVLLQGVPQIDRLSIYEKELDTLGKDVDTKLGKVSVPKPPQPPSKPYLAFTSYINRLSDRVGVKASTSMMVVFFVLAAILLCAVTSCLFSWPLRTRGQQGGLSAPQSSKDIERMLAHTSPVPGSLGPPNRQYQRAVSGASLSAAAPMNAFIGTDGHIAASPPSGVFLPDPREMSPSCASLTVTEQQRMTAKPPPLCPTLVMPMSEALLGIQMYELAQLDRQGSLNIVGISGKPLLRAEVKKMGGVRSLEIGMPEPNSIPRASIAPPMAGESQHYGSRALEIRGMRGQFYGILEMRSSGACYVVKDGQTVLTIDGDAESLQLSLKSSVGLQLAAVRCSSEQFEGVDHVEIRVEPGVDTVLVVAVVLAVLLLSPYLPPADD